MKGFRINLMARFLLIGVAALLLISGCSYLGGVVEGDAEKTPQELIAEGVRDMERGRYTRAIEAFQDVRDRYPYSRYAVLAELRIADAEFYREEYDAAFEAYDEFEKLHPKNEYIPYVIYQKGMCHFKRMTSPEKDQHHTSKAKEVFERLVRRFPRSEYAKRARKNIRKCLLFLAEHELHVGHFYFKKGKYRAALARYNYLLQNYPDMGQYDEALEYISRSKAKLAQGYDRETEGPVRGETRTIMDRIRSFF